MATFLVPSDISPFIPDVDEAKAQATIDDATAIAVSEAPCLSGTLTDDQAAAVKAVLRGAIVRYMKSGETVNKTWEAAGPFSQGFQAQPMSRGTFYPSELKALRKICDAVAGFGGAFAFDTAPSVPVISRSNVTNATWLTDIEP